MVRGAIDPIDKIIKKINLQLIVLVPRSPRLQRHSGEPLHHPSVFDGVSDLLGRWNLSNHMTEG